MRDLEEQLISLKMAKKDGAYSVPVEITTLIVWLERVIKAESEIIKHKRALDLACVKLPDVLLEIASKETTHE